ncbi:MAG: permease, partial [Candidatus Hodarchaeales archaeon]
MIYLIKLLQGALESAFLTLLDYLSLHVLLCLVPAFFIAGAMTYFKIAYPVATAGGFLLAVCSCTVLPLFVGIWKKGAGLGPAITFLFVAPAVNILALTYTGTLIGLDIAIARAILAIVFALVIGVIMAKTFGNETEHDSNSKNSTNYVNGPNRDVSTGTPMIDKLTISLITILGISAILLAILDTYIINIIGNALLLDIPPLYPLFSIPAVLQTLIFTFGLTILVILSFKINSKELLLFLWLIYILMTGTSQITYFTEKVEVFGLFLNPSISNMLAKLVLTGIVLIGLISFTWNRFNSEEVNAWFMETWIFIKSIFPLIITGVAIAGFVKFFLPQDLVIALVGQNT